MRIASLLIVGCAALTAALTPAQINQKFKKMQNISLRCIKKANQLEASDGVNPNSPSSRFHHIFKGMDEINSLADEISAAVESLPSPYSEADSTSVLDGFSSFSGDHVELYVTLNGKRTPFAGMTNVCEAISTAIESDQAHVGRVGLAFLPKVATARDRYVVTRIRQSLGKGSNNVRILYCMAPDGSS